MLGRARLPRYTEGGRTGGREGWPYVANRVNEWDVGQSPIYAAHEFLLGCPDQVFGAQI